MALTFLPKVCTDCKRAEADRLAYTTDLRRANEVRPGAQQQHDLPRRAPCCLPAPHKLVAAPVITARKGRTLSQCSLLPFGGVATFISALDDSSGNSEKCVPKGIDTVCISRASTRARQHRSCAHLSGCTLVNGQARVIMQAESGSVLVRGILHLVGQNAYFALISLQADIRTCVEVGMRVISRT